MDNQLSELHYWLTHPPSVNGASVAEWARRIILLYNQLKAAEIEWAHRLDNVYITMETIIDSDVE